MVEVLKDEQGKNGRGRKYECQASEILDVVTRFRRQRREVNRERGGRERERERERV